MKKKEQQTRGRNVDKKEFIEKKNKKKNEMDRKKM